MTTENNKVSSDRHRVLLDLLAGWELFASSDTNPLDHQEDYVNAIHELYQMVGQKEDMSRQEIHIFIVDKILPIVLMAGKMPKSKAP